jgi:hypothetical protein
MDNQLRIPDMVSGFEVTHGMKYAAEMLAESRGFQHWRKPAWEEFTSFCIMNDAADKLHLKAKSTTSGGQEYEGGLLYDTVIIAATGVENITSQGTSILFLGLSAELRYAPGFTPRAISKSVVEAGAAMIIYKGLDVTNPPSKDLWALTLYQDNRLKRKIVEIKYGLEKISSERMAFDDKNPMHQKKLFEHINEILR